MKFDNNNPPAWCPGCGNFAILSALKKALEEMNWQNRDTVLVSGIGQASKTPQYVSANYFNGLHGRAIPAACGVKAANKNLNVVVTAGDGDTYGEGANHLLHAIRRNHDITVFVYNNMVYGLTKGQPSPTSKTAHEPFSPVAVAVAQNISFVARAFCKNIEQTKEIMKQALSHKGFALVDILTPCVTFNKVNTYKWLEDNSYELEGHDSANRLLALDVELKSGKMPLGVIFKQDRPTFEMQGANAHKMEAPLYQHKVSLEKLRRTI
jgi:2-oxoglutarate ferredoxin oxidoreductase subunit beta